MHTKLQINEYKLSIIFLMFTTFFWGSTFILVKETITTVPIHGFLSVRFLTSAAILLIALLITNREELRKLLDTEVLRYGSVLGTLLYLSFLFQTIGLSETTPAKAAFITGLNVILVPIIAALPPFRKQITRHEFAYAAMSLAGLALMTLDISTLSVARGDAIILLTATAVAYHVVITEKAAERPLVPMVTVQLLVVGIEASAVAVIYRQTWNPLTEQTTEVAWITLAVTAILATAFAFWSQTYAQKMHVKPTEIALIFAMEPVFALAIDLVVGTIPSFTVLVGMILILYATYAAVKHISS